MTFVGRISLLLALCAVLGLATAAGAQQLEPVLREQAAADKAAIAAQGRIDALADETQGMAAKYRQAVRDAENLKKYDAQLATQLESQRGELASLREQLQ